MKKGFFWNVLMIISISIATISCSTSDDNSNNNNNIIAELIQQATDLMLSSNWMITNFNDSGQNETSNFNGYTFSFNTNGTLVANKGTTTINGTWSITIENSNSNSSSDDIDFNIFFATPSDFNELSEDWEIVSRTNTKIDLKHVSGGNGGTDLLTFEKN